MISNIGESYVLVNGCPVLIDFESSVVDKSILEREVVQRTKFYQNKLPLIRGLVNPNYRKTKENFSFILDQINKKGESVNVLIVGGGTVGKHVELFFQNK